MIGGEGEVVGSVSVVEEAEIDHTRATRQRRGGYSVRGHITQPAYAEVLRYPYPSQESYQAIPDRPWDNLEAEYYMEYGY